MRGGRVAALTWIGAAGLGVGVGTGRLVAAYAGRQVTARARTVASPPVAIRRTAVMEWTSTTGNGGDRRPKVGVGPILSAQLDVAVTRPEIEKPLPEKGRGVLNSRVSGCRLPAWSAPAGAHRSLFAP